MRHILLFWRRITKNETAACMPSPVEDWTFGTCQFRVRADPVLRACNYYNVSPGRGSLRFALALLDPSCARAHVDFTMTTQTTGS